MNKEFISDINGLRIDKFLSYKMPEFSRSEIVKFDVFLNGTKVNKFSIKVKIGDVLKIKIKEKINTNQIENIKFTFNLNIVFEDDHIIVINKPRHITMYPGPGNYIGTLLQNVLAHTNLSNLGGVLRRGVVHRLDKDTSGLVVLAKTDEAYKELIQTFKDKQVIKQYIAFIWGIPNLVNFSIEGGIKRSNKNRQKMKFVNVGGKNSKTDVITQKVWSDCNVSKVKCILKTGRTHQIRVHLSSHGFPILCDEVYGNDAKKIGEIKNKNLLNFIKNNKGQMLHSYYLSFKHPITKENLIFKTTLPDDMKTLQNLLNNNVL